MIASAEAWAAENVSWLQAVLDRPDEDHNGLAVAPDGICIAHVVGLVSQLAKNPGGPWKQYYEGRLKGGQHVALHAWLYHLGGGAAAKLCAPMGSTNGSRDLVRPIETEAIHHKRLRAEANSKRAKQVDRGMSTNAVDAELAHLDDIALTPFNWGLLQSKHAAAAPQPQPQPVPTLTERSTAERDLRWLIARAASSPASPVYSLGGHGDLLLTICEMSCIGGMACWEPLRRARPQTETLRALYFMHAETVAL